MKTHNILMVLTMATALMVFGVGCVTSAQTDRANATVSDVGTRVSDTTAAVGKVGPTLANSLMRAATDAINAVRSIVDAAIGRPAPAPGPAVKPTTDITPPTPGQVQMNGPGDMKGSAVLTYAPPDRMTLRGEDVSSAGWQPQARQELRDKLDASQ